MSGSANFLGQLGGILHGVVTFTARLEPISQFEPLDQVGSITEQSTLGVLAAQVNGDLPTWFQHFVIRDDLSRTSYRVSEAHRVVFGWFGGIGHDHPRVL